MITLLRWRKTKNNGRNKDAVVKVCNSEALCSRVCPGNSRCTNNPHPHCLMERVFNVNRKLAASLPGNVPALPLEIIDKILRETCELPPRRTDRQVLSTCAVVCKSWLPFVQSLLYHSLTVENSRIYVSRTPGTLGPAALLHRPHLLAYTRSLTLRVIDEFAPTLPVCNGKVVPAAHPECVRIPDFLSLLAHTPGLRHLRLAIVWSRKNRYSFEPSILDWLSSLALPIQVLDLKYGQPFDSPLVCDLVRLWPTIRALRVRTDYGLPLPPERPSACLRELRLPITSLAAVVEWFLPPVSRYDRSDLRILELYEIPEGRHTLLSAHASSVSCLTLTRQPATGLADLFTNLEELIIAGPFWSGPLPTLPKTLMHIRLQVHAFMSDSVVPAITAAVPSLGNLRALSVEEALTTDTHYPALRQVCEANRVEILVNPMNPLFAGTVVSPLPLPSPENPGPHLLIIVFQHPYFAEMDRFPRQRTFSEFFDVRR
jgi:hypothetical protein